MTSVISRDKSSCLEESFCHDTEGPKPMPSVPILTLSLAGMKPLYMTTDRETRMSGEGQEGGGGSGGSGLDMTPEELRQWGYRAVDFVVRYLETVEDRPVFARVAPGEIRGRLPVSPPERGEPFDRVLRDVEEIILPGITHWQSPSFFGYFPANSSGPAVLGELVAAGLGVQGMLWSTSPACTELETHVLDWMSELLGLPECFRSSGQGGGVIEDSASSAALCALLAARERALGGRGNREGCARGGGGELTLYATSEAHSSLEKAVRIAGLGDASLRRAAVDERLAMRPEDLARRVAEDRAAGLRPCFVAATIGTTSTNAMDPLVPIGAICRREGLWLHVDGAMSGIAALCPELRRFQEGIELADSYCTNPHKWMFTNFDCDCFFVRDRAPLIGALSILPEYLRNQASQSGAVIDYRDWQVPLGRRFRALKLWFVIRHYGAEGLRARIREHVALAQELVAWIDSDPDFERPCPAPLNLVCFRRRGPDELNEQLLASLNASGRLFLSHTKVGGRFTLRISVGQTHVQRRHVEAAWRLIQQTARELGQGPVPGPG